MKKRYTLTEIDAILEGKKVSIDRIVHIQTDDAYYQRNREEEMSLIEAAMLRVQELDRARAHGDVLIEQLKKDAHRLRKERILVVHRTKIERILSLQGRINELSNETEKVQSS